MRLRVILFILAFTAARAFAQQPEKGTWRAASHTATSILGDIAISGSKITINFTSFVIAPVRSLKPSEVSAAFDEALDTAGNGQLYRVNIPAAQRFLKKNTLCGTQDTRWMAVYVKNRTLEIAFFSGEEAPLMTFEALQGSADLCGTFSFVR